MYWKCVSYICMALSAKGPLALILSVLSPTLFGLQSTGVRNKWLEQTEGPYFRIPSSTFLEERTELLMPQVLPLVLIIASFQKSLVIKLCAPKAICRDALLSFALSRKVSMTSLFVHTIPICNGLLRRSRKFRD